MVVALIGGRYLQDHFGRYAQWQTFDSGFDINSEASCHHAQTTAVPPFGQDHDEYKEIRRACQRNVRTGMRRAVHD